MTYTSYASGRSTLPISGNTFVVTNNGNLGVTGTYYVGLIAENRVGLSLTSTLTAVTLTTTSKLTITLPTILAGEDWQNIIIGASLTNDVTTLTQIASVSKVDFSTPLVLTTNQVFKLTLVERTVANPAGLPVTPEQGLCRYITSLNYYYKYDKYSDKTVDNLNVLNATTGRWLRIGSISTYQSNTSSSGGCDVDVRTPNLTVVTPNYLCDGSTGEGVLYWLRNDGDDDIPSGTRISCLIRLGDEDYSQRFSGMFELEIMGYVNLTNAVLDITTSSNPITYDPKVEWLTLTEDLQPNNAVVIKVSPQFRAEQLSGAIPYNAAISAYLQFSPTTGIYTPGVFGNLIYQDRNKWRIVPNTGLSLLRLAGSGIVAKQELNALGDYIVTGLTANTANQNIFLSSNGTAFVNAANTLDGVAKRCKVSTVNGTGIVTSYGNVNLDNTKQLTVTVNYPTAIRSDYPDTLIAGLNKGKFNASKVVIYIKNSSNQYFKIEKIITPNVTSDSWTVDYSEFSSAALPSVASDYGLYKPTSVTPTTTTVASTFTSGSYEVLIAFVYSGVVTVIDHSVSELYEITADLQTIFETVATVWYSDNGIPSNSLGENGAYYLNYDTANIYKKVNDTWVLDGNISVSTPSFGTIAVSGQSNVVADNSNDTLTLVAGTGITLTTNATTDAITITGTSVSNTFSTIVVAGQSNIVADSGTDTLTIEAGSGITLTTNATTDTLTIASNAANNTFSTLSVAGQSDIVADTSSDTLTLVAGSGITLTTNPTTDTLTITGSSVSNTFSTIAVSGQNNVVADSASDTLTLIAGTGMTITTDATSDTITLASSGTSATVNVGTVTTLNPNQSPTVTNTGTTSAAVLAFGLPLAPTTSIGTVSTLSAGSSATVTNTGSNGNVVLNFGIPQGANGSMNVSSGFILTPVGSPITTSTNEVGFYVDSADSLFKTRDVSNGTVRTLASLNRVQAFTQTQYATPVVNNSASGTVTLDGSASNVFILTVTGNLTLNMNNIQVGATYIIYLIQDATGSRTITLNAIFKRLVGDTTTFNTSANRVNMLTGIARSASAITLSPIVVEVV
jgi:hypothetical protein